LAVTEPTETPIGRGRPPTSSRFRKGQSGNPKGRPRGSTARSAPYQKVLGQTVSVREDGVIRRMSAAEAFLLHITRRGLEGDGAAARAAMTAIEDARTRRGPWDDDDRPTVVVMKFVGSGSVNSGLTHLRAAAVLDPYRETARLALEPWLVEAALDRLGDRRLTHSEQETIWRSARTPRKVKWPDWWEYEG
jgi:hypothetical protein